MKISLSTKVAFATFFIAGVGVLIVSFLSFMQMSEYFKKHLLDTLVFELHENSRVIQENLEDVINDVKLLGTSEDIKAIHRAMTNKYHYDAKSNDTYMNLKQKLGLNFRSILEHSDAYFNIRLIYFNGEELVVGVKDRKGKVTIKNENFLQNKGNRNYFKESILLGEGDVYISDIDLNREHGKLSFPYIPTIRVATPIYIEDKLFAILIINSNIYKLFRPLQSKFSSGKNLYLANEEGYYLFHKEREKTFGFELDKEYKLTDDFDLSQNASFEDGKAFVYKQINFNDEKFVTLAISETDKLLHQQSLAYQKELLLYIVIITFFIALSTLLLVRYFITPLVKLTRSAREISQGKIGTSKGLSPVKTNDEIGELYHSLELMLEQLESSKESVQAEVQARTQELNELNENLEKIVNQKTDENIKQLKVMQEQTKMASMGEMIGAIAHQWRQPLNEISISIQNLKYDYEDGKVDGSFVQHFIDKNKKVIQFMSTTIDDFRNFYRVDKTKETFDVKKAVDNTLSLQKAQLLNNNIEIIVNEESFEVNGYKNEFQQVVLNIINNAKDALLENSVKNAKIIITIKDKVVSIRDNAGGVPLEIQERLFEPYFTTKEQGKGTGMGLYMSKMMIEENMNAKLSVSNVDGGAEFRMDFNEL